MCFRGTHKFFSRCNAKKSQDPTNRKQRKWLFKMSPMKTWEFDYKINIFWLKITFPKYHWKLRRLLTVLSLLLHVVFSDRLLLCWLFFVRLCFPYDVSNRPKYVSWVLYFCKSSDRMLILMFRTHYADSSIWTPYLLFCYGIRVSCARRAEINDIAPKCYCGIAWHTATIHMLGLAAAGPLKRSNENWRPIMVLWYRLAYRKDCMLDWLCSYQCRFPAEPKMWRTAQLDMKTARCDEAYKWTIAKQTLYHTFVNLFQAS